LYIAQYREAAAFLAFGADVLDDFVLKTLAKGSILLQILKQGILSYLNLSQEIILLYAATSGHLQKFGINSPVIFFIRHFIEINFAEVFCNDTSLLLNVLIEDQLQRYTWSIFRYSANKYLHLVKRLVKDLQINYMWRKKHTFLKELIYF